MKHILLLLYALLLFSPKLYKAAGFTPLNCPSGYVVINPFTCALDNSFMPQSKCPTSKGCQTSYVCAQDKECPSLTKCPDNLSIRCPDNSCVETKADCNDYVSCPSFLPIRCPNGDCKKN